MILPSIDLMNGCAVQLVGGRDRKIDAGDPRPLARQFSLTGEIAVVDLDAALGQGDNARVIHELLDIAPCRVGGGIRDVRSAIQWLDAGATKVVLGTAATPEVLRSLPSDRVVVALDAVDGEVVTHGWRTHSGATIEQRLQELRGLADEFLITFVEREGRMVGIDPDRVRALVDAAGDAQLTIAGGVRDAQDIAAIDRLGAHAQIGMALYSGAISLAEALTAPMQSDRPDGLWPTVIVDERGIALGLAYSNAASVHASITSRTGVYYSRSQSGLWQKGATSGATQELMNVALDCDRDALRFTVRQHGPGFCHNGTYSCWGDSSDLGALARRLDSRRNQRETGSYTARLFENADLLAAKLREEADELARATTRKDVVWEAADVLYFTLVKLMAAGIELPEVERELAQRARKVTRRPGDAKSVNTNRTGPC